MNMKKINYLTILISGLMLFGAVTLAHSAPIGSTTGSFMRIGFGADRLAMGDCGVAMIGSGMNWYYNPAALAYQSSRQVSIGYRNMALDRFVMYSDFSMPIHPNAGLAIGVVRAGTSDIEFRDSNGKKFDEITHSDNLIHGSFSLMPHPMVSLGISVKWMINSVPNVLEGDKNLYAYGMSIDFGVLVRALENLRIGLQLRDVNGQYSWETSEVWGDPSVAKVDEFPSLVRFGAAYDPLQQLTVTSDLIMNLDELSEGVEIHFGTEYRLTLNNENLNGFALRAGWNGNRPAFGFGMDMNLRKLRARFDYAFQLEEVAPSGSHLIGWVFEF